jgi:hypothetical protein
MNKEYISVAESLALRVHKVQFDILPRTTQEAVYNAARIAVDGEVDGRETTTSF